ncbi:MAG TPA: ribosome biogenesis factor YjgA [Gallionella sp.]|nr:ribosome biogenesis factor YjgA [Gallionella sp.]
MSPHKKDQHKDEVKNEPLHIHLGDDEDEHDDAEVHDGELQDAGEHDDGAVEVIRPHARSNSNTYTRGRGLCNQPPAEEEEELPPSKTKIKKQMHELRDLGKELTELGKDQIAQLDIPESLRDAIREMKNINKFGAQRRQMQYIGKLMREVDTAPILAKLDTWKGKSQHHVAYMHQLERWRDRLMESDSALTELLAAHPQTDAQHLRTLIRNAHKETIANKPPKSYREIFQVLREIIPESA